MDALDGGTPQGHHIARHGGVYPSESNRRSWRWSPGSPLGPVGLAVYIGAFANFDCDHEIGFVYIYAQRGSAFRISSPTWRPVRMSPGEALVDRLTSTLKLRLPSAARGWLRPGPHPGWGRNFKAEPVLANH
jgi:hypothetical protein